MTEITLPDLAPWDYQRPTWQLILAELNGDNLAEVTDATDRTFTFQHNRPQTVEFKLDLSSPAAAPLLTQQQLLVKAYKFGALQMTTEVSTIQTAGTEAEKKIAVVATEAPWVRLAKRYIGQTVNGEYYESWDRGWIAAWSLTALNATMPTGIGVGSIQESSTVNAGPFYFKPHLELLQELSAPLNGFDFWFTPADPSLDANDYAAYLNIAPLRGGPRPEVVFEYGADTRANVREYEWLTDLTTRITRAISLPPTYPDNLGLPIKTAFDAPTEAAILRREDIIQSDLADEGLRQNLVDEHVAVRKNPRNLFKFQPHIDDGTGRVPSFLVDYDIGDIIEGRVKDQDLLFLDGLVRVFGAKVELDDAGTESVTLTLLEEE